jgi:hypothetical protein
MSLVTSLHRGPRELIVVVRVLLIDGSELAFVWLVVVVVAVVAGVVVVVVQPTIATTQTPKTSGISFFIGLVLSEHLRFHNPALSTSYFLLRDMDRATLG